MVGDWPLVGREDERAYARTTVLDDGVGGIVLAGLAGVGKTRLASEA